MPLRSVTPLILLTVAVVGCSSGEKTDVAMTGVRLQVRYDSSLDVDAFTVFAVDTAGAVLLEPTPFEAPLFLEPPGERTATVVVEIPTGQDGMDLDVRIDGTDDGSVVGSGQTGVTLESARLVDASVRLGSPTACGDGRIHPTLETCDDGNAAPDDGCSALCIPEPGYVCRGAPSFCTACGNNRVETGESCDDGNRIDGDGCSAVCVDEMIPLENVIEVSLPDRFIASTPEFVSLEGTLNFTVEGGEAWLVFVSGAMGASDIAETTGIARVMLDDQERDRFGHQAYGGDNNEGGFLTFLAVQDEGAHQVRLDLASEVGEAWVRDVRLVAARLPPGADLQYFDSDENPSRAGIDLTIDQLDLNPASPGEYIFLARASVSESPGGDTVQTWVTAPSGERYPNAPNGVGYSNGRDALVPMFVAFQETINAESKLAIHGTSSGTGPATWWNNGYLARRELVAPNVPADYALSVTFDHASLVGAGASRADGRDIRVVWSVDGRASQLDRVLDPTSSWNSGTTTIWYRVPAQVTTAGALVHLYFANDVPNDDPPQNPNNVFTYFSQLDDPAEWTTVTGNPTFNNGRMVLEGGTAVTANVALPVGGPPQLYETFLRFTGQNIQGPARYFGLGGTPSKPGAEPEAWFEVGEGGHIVRAVGLQQSGWQPSTPDTFHRYGFTQGPMAVSRFTQDDFEIATLTPVQLGVQDPHIFMENGDPTGINQIYDWVLVRPFSDPEPVVQLGGVEGPAGILQSTWRHRRLAAFRADAFGLVQSSAAPGLVTTTSTFTEIVHTLETDTPSRATEYLVVQSARIAGDSSATAAKSGVLLANGEEIMRTQHRVTRDDSADSGYHHVAGAAYRRVTDEAVVYQNGIASPDGIRVSIAASSILVFRYSSP